MLLILFGLSGAGKNFVGEILASKFGFYFWDADTHIPQNMRLQIQKKEPLTRQMRDEFTEIMIAHIARLKDQYPDIVVSQALYKEKNRQQIASGYPDARFILIKATGENRRSRLQKRNDWIDWGYAEKLALYFEDPQRGPVIMNDSDSAAVILQLRNILNKQE